jgi:hypothetical protein
MSITEPSPSKLEFVASDTSKGVMGGLETVFSLILYEFDALNKDGGVETTRGWQDSDSDIEVPGNDRQKLNCLLTPICKIYQVNRRKYSNDSTELTEMEEEEAHCPD